MDLNAELTTLAASGATQVVSAIATDAWPAVKAAVLALWRRSHPERVEADLEQAREDLLSAQESGRPEELQVLLVNEWQARLSRLLVAYPELADELRSLVAGLVAERGPDGARTTGPVTMTAHVTGGGDAYQAGRDLTVHRPTAG
ncbi:hypothetical protein GCM10018790_15900 [Kitasatospora xanthocidica]|uniref:hypothetical protein n=1 Tax=Kitasatospora xanthocidica TaxID=83382 RepID=UPI001677DAA3|nr:hypothetical protein [Kitasatospora xanthocidica]GHF38924.1 hypothetical protein GCM10018790_15900 [Kitasatospora xanthocidica]